MITVKRYENKPISSLELKYCCNFCTKHPDFITEIVGAFTFLCDECIAIKSIKDLLNFWGER